MESGVKLDGGTGKRVYRPTFYTDISPLVSYFRSIKGADNITIFKGPKIEVVKQKAELTTYR